MPAAKNGLKTLFVDTQYVVALVNGRDQYHASVMALGEKYDDYPLLTTDAVLMEIGNGLARRYKPEAVEIIERFLRSDDITVVAITPELFREGLDLYRNYDDKEWGLIDCFSFVVMQREGVTEALTFDQHFVQAGFTALLREPS